jgi:hypothetical protein
MDVSLPTSCDDAEHGIRSVRPPQDGTDVCVREFDQIATLTGEEP